MQHKITSDWVPADDSENHLEFAATDRDDLVAIRDSFDPENGPVYATTSQLRDFAREVNSGQKGRLGRILGPSMRT